MAQPERRQSRLLLETVSPLMHQHSEERGQLVTETAVGTADAGTAWSHLRLQIRREALQAVQGAGVRHLHRLARAEARAALATELAPRTDWMPPLVRIVLIETQPPGVSKEKEHNPVERGVASSSSSSTKNRPTPDLAPWTD
jgi:hypothetical protein